MTLFKFFVWFTFFFAATVIFSSTPIYSILSLICIISSGCFILFLLRIEFLSFMLLLLYIGAIAILFLFVVMMVPSSDQFQKLNMVCLSPSGILYSAFVLKVFYFISYFNYQFSNTLTLFSYQYLNFSSIINYTFISNLRIAGDSVIFVSIFTQKYFLFLLVSIILLFAMVGSIVLCLQEKNE